MGESIGDILKNQTGRSEPTEFHIIRQFIEEKYQCTPKLSTTKSGIVIGVPDAGIAGNLRFDIVRMGNLINANQSDKGLRLTIRIIPS